MCSKISGILKKIKIKKCLFLGNRAWKEMIVTIKMSSPSALDIILFFFLVP